MASTRLNLIHPKYQSRILRFLVTRTTVPIVSKCPRIFHCNQASFMSTSSSSGHNWYIPPNLSNKYRNVLIVTLSGLVLFTFPSWPLVQAKSVEDTESENDLKVSSDESEGKEKKKREKVGFSDRKFIEYENRIRSFSTPDKIFR